MDVKEHHIRSRETELSPAWESIGEKSRAIDENSCLRLLNSSIEHTDFRHLQEMLEAPMEVLAATTPNARDPLTPLTHSPSISAVQAHSAAQSRWLKAGTAAKNASKAVNALLMIIEVSFASVTTRGARRSTHQAALTCLPSPDRSSTQTERRIRSKSTTATNLRS